MNSKRFEAAGWITDACDGHDAADVHRALTKAQDAAGPVLIACRTIIGFGLPTAGTQKAHSDAPGAEAIAFARKALGWTYEPFVIPDDLLNQWRAIGSRGREDTPGLGSAQSRRSEGPRIRRRPRRHAAFVAGRRASMPSRNISAPINPSPAPANIRKKPWM